MGALTRLSFPSRNIFTVRWQAFAAMIFPIYRSVFSGIIYEYCERM